MASFPASALPLARNKRGSGKTRPVGSFFQAASARKLVGCFVGPVDLAEHHSKYLKSLRVVSSKKAARAGARD